MADNGNDQNSGFWSPEFWRNTGFASVAAAVAVAVENNPSFVVWLASAAVVCFVIAGLHGRLHRWIVGRLWLVGVPLGLVAVCFVGLGVYLAAYGKEEDSATVDEVARGQAIAAQQHAASLNASVSALSAEVATAMKFQENEKREREATEKRESEERRMEQEKKVQAQRQREAVCSRMETLRREAIALRVRLVQADASPPLRKEVIEFINRACSELPASECRAFQAASGPGGGPVGYPFDDGGFWSAITGRINFLARQLETACR